MGEIADALRRAREGRPVEKPGASSRPDGSEAADARRAERAEPLAPRSDFHAAMPAPEPLETPQEPDTELIDIGFADASLLLDDTPGLEACRRLAVRVRDAMDRRKVRSVAVVSSTRGEGKTTLACNLALALASLSAGREVALVDLDLRRPSLAHVFGLSPSIGIEQVLRGGACLEEARVGVERPPVDLYPVVDPQRSAHELLVTSTFRDMLRQLEERYHVVLFDTAPTLAVPDVSLMLRHVGACIPVARMGITRTRNLRQLLDVLPRNKVLGPVLNGTRLSPDVSYYYAADETHEHEHSDPSGRSKSWTRRNQGRLRGGDA
jgi:Mrp family chromosome partitioning ATPase